MHDGTKYQGVRRAEKVANRCASQNQDKPQIRCPAQLENEADEENAQLNPAILADDLNRIGELRTLMPDYPFHDE